jgi:hypothetical protein
VHAGAAAPRAGLALQAQRRPAAVQRIGHQRVADAGQVHADLVRAPGVQRAAQRTDVRRHGQPHVGARRLAARHHRHAHARHRVAADRRLDAQLARRARTPCASAR